MFCNFIPIMVAFFVCLFSMKVVGKRFGNKLLKRKSCWTFKWKNAKNKKFPFLCCFLFFNELKTIRYCTQFYLNEKKYDNWITRKAKLIRKKSMNKDWFFIFIIYTIYFLLFFCCCLHSGTNKSFQFIFFSPTE